MCLNPGDILRDRYRIIATLGEGGFARTYTAVDLYKSENSPCVVKEISAPQSDDPRVLPRAQELFNREASSLELLGHHSQIPALIEHFQEHQKFYIVQEFIDGHPLKDKLIPNQPWTESQVAELLRKILEILQFVHQNEVIHRDITPSNLIRRNSDGTIVLIDFGAVKEIGTLQITQSGQSRTTVIGTPGYAPPEQLDGQPRFCSDIYAAGIIAIQAITGLHIDDFFHSRNTGELVWHYSTDDRPIVEISDDLRNILNKMVRYYFNDRYQSAADVLQDLREAMLSRRESLTVLPPPPPPPPVPSVTKRKWKDRLRVCLFIAIAGLVGLGVFLIHNFFQPKTCPLIKGDALSCGEEILIKTSSPRLKQKGVEEFAQSNYQSAFDLFKKSWDEEYGKDPETLIYMNNAFLEANKSPYYTIAIALPISRRNQDSSTHMGDRAKEFLRGVAQAQTEVNLGLPNSRRNHDFPGQDFLQGKAINGKGLKVIISNDGNDEKEAKQRAISLVNQPGILAVVGHANSDMTMHTVDIYNQNNLVLMSPGAATEELTYEPRNFFFRTQYTSSLIAQNLADYLLAKNQKQVAILYNQASPFSASFREEFTKYFRDSQGGKIVGIRDFDLSRKDFNAERAIKEIQANRETAIVLVPDDQVTKSLENAFEIMKLNGDRNWIVGAWTLMRLQTLELASGQQQTLFKKLIMSVGWHPLNSPNKEFPQQARSLWGGEVNTRTASNYDAARAIIKALEMQPNPSREEMQKTLSSPDFSADGATGTIQFNSPENGDRKNPPRDLVHIVECAKEQFGLTFVPVKYPTAAAAGLNCD